MYINLSLSLSLSIYLYIYMYVCIYILMRSDTVLAQVRGEFAEVPYRAFGLLLRAVLLAAGTRAAAEEDDGGDFSDVIHVGMWEYECLYTMMFLLACEVDVSALPPVTPSVHCVHVAALYQGVVSVVTGIAQVFRVEGSGFRVQGSG